MNEFSELFAVDVCLGNQILEAFEGLSGGPREFQEFLTRPANQKVMRHDTDSAQSFIKNYIADAKAVTTVEGHRVNLPLLPICWYCRKPGLAASDIHVDGPFNKWRTLWAEPDDDEPTIAKIRMLSVALNYNLAFVARDKPALDKLLLAWFSFVADTRSLHHRFKVPFHISGLPDAEGADVEMPAEIRDAKTCSFDDATVAEMGVFGASTTLEVHASVLIGEAVSVTDPIRFQWALEAWHGA